MTNNGAPQPSSDKAAPGAAASQAASEIPFAKHLGLVVASSLEGASELRFVPRPEHLNSMGVVHGGATMTLLDVTMAVAAGSAVPGSSVVTVEMKTSFLRALAGPLVCRGRLLHKTSSMAFMEASVHDSHGDRCAHATGTFKYRKQNRDPERERAGLKEPQVPVSGNTKGTYDR